MFVVVGTTTVDLFISGLEALPRTDGDEFTASSLAYTRYPLTMTLGGNGANSAYVLAALGGDVALCSAIGQDALGEMVLGWLGERNIYLRGVVRSPSHGTATTTSVTDDRFNRISFYYPGYLHDLKFADLPASLFDEATTLLITGVPLLPGLRPAGFASALAAARARGAVTALDIGPALDPPARLDELVPLLSQVDYLLTNEYELGICTGERGVLAGVRRLLDAGAQTVVVKHGKDGGSAYTGGEEVCAAGYPVRATVTVGAGDSFNSGFLFALRNGLPLTDALAFGNATAAIVVASGRSVLGAPSREAVEAALRRGYVDDGTAAQGA